MKKYKKGYTTGVFDMFHVGHLNILKKSKELCDFLIVGITTDELVSYKNKKAIINFEDRSSIVSSIIYTDQVVPQKDMNKVGAFKKYNFEVVFVGSDWKGTDKWIEIEKNLKEYNVDVVYFDYTMKVSSTSLQKHLETL